MVVKKKSTLLQKVDFLSLKGVLSGSWNNPVMVTNVFEVPRCARSIVTVAVTVAVGKGHEVAKSRISVAVEMEVEQPYPILLLIPLFLRFLAALGMTRSVRRLLDFSAALEL